MQHITYNDLVARYGKAMAYVALVIIENSAKVARKQVVSFDCEKRLCEAFAQMRETACVA
jgi:hypothetical protein